MKKNSRKVLAVSLFFAIFSSIVFSGTAKAALLFPTDVISNSGGIANCPNGGTLRPYTDTLMAQALDKPGYVFAGWTTASDGTGTLYPDQADCSNFANYSHIYAQWTQAPTSTVTFDANGGEGSMDPQIAAGNNDLASVAFLRSFYDFAGWNTAADGTGTFYDDEETYSFASDITLYAQWVPVFTVTFDGNGGSANNMWSQTSSSSDRLRSNTFTRNGYTFSGWTSNADGSGSAYENRGMYDFSADLTLYAQWTSTSSTSTVTFDANGGTGSMSDQTSSVSANLAANTFTYTDRIFNGWNTNAGGSGGDSYGDGASYNFASDLTLYAQWISGSTVTFDANNGSGSMEPQTARGSVALTTNSFTRTGYDFDGWTENADGSGTSYVDGENYQFQADSLSNKLLYAKWTAHSSGTKGTLILVQDPDGQPFSSGTSPAFTVTMPQATLNSDIHFLDIGAVANGSYWRPIVDNNHCRGFQWATNGNLLRCGISSITIGGVETKNSWKAAFLPFYAGVFLQWEGSPFSSTTSDIVITFVSGAFTLSDVNANYLVTTKTRSWDDVIEVASVNVTVGTPPPSHTVTFDVNGGQGSMSTQTAAGSNALTTNSFTRSGYRFSGWNTNAGGSGGDSYGDGSTYSFSADVTLYAQWTSVSVSSTVTFIDPISTSLSQQTASGSSPLTSNSFTRNGYSFAGWNTEANGSGTSYTDGANYSFASNLTLYAQWRSTTSAPSAPTSVVATATGATTANVSFTAPASDGGATITSYTATSSPGAITGSISQSTSGTIAMTGLTAGTSYTFTVRATNSAGAGTASSASNSITTVGAPSAPTSVVATATGKRSATVSFAAPASNGGSAITSYTAISTPGGIAQTLTQATGGTFNFDGLQPGTAYTFELTATNAIGTSSATVSNSIDTIPLVVSSISTLKFVDDGTGTAGKIVWSGKNIDSVLYTGPANSYPGPYSYGAFTSGWNGTIRNLEPDKTYTVSIFAVSPDGVGETKELTFKTSASQSVLAGSDNSISTVTSSAQSMSTKLAPVLMWIEENTFVPGEGANMSNLLMKFDALQTSAHRSYLKVPTSRVSIVDVKSLTPKACSVVSASAKENAGLVTAISSEKCTISYTVSGASKAPTTLIKDFVFTKFNK